MINSTFYPARIIDCDGTKLSSNAQGVGASITAGSAQNIDLLLTDDMLITGFFCIVYDANAGDNVNIEVVDVSGSLTGTPNTVMATPLQTAYVPNHGSFDDNISYPIKLAAGVTIRLIYQSTGSTSPFFGITYKLHKVLI